MPSAASIKRLSIRHKGAVYIRIQKSFARTLLIGILLFLTAGCSADGTDIKPPVSDNENGKAASDERTNGSADGYGKTDEKQNCAEEGENLINLQIGEYLFTATLVDNSATETLREMLAKGPLTIDMNDYGNMEKVGSFGTSLPRNDEPITTEPGDLILYQGNAFVIYYAPNSWTFTRIGKINDVTPQELKQALGNGAVTVTLSLVQD